MTWGSLTNGNDDGKGHILALSAPLQPFVSTTAEVVHRVVVACRHKPRLGNHKIVDPILHGVIYFTKSGRVGGTSRRDE